jgi:hypothetical protein
MFKIHQLLDSDWSCRRFYVLAALCSQLESQKKYSLCLVFFHGSLGPIPVPGPKLF